MTISRSYDTVAFDTRDDMVLLFFARTDEEGNIEDYLLLMRSSDGEFTGDIFVEINESMFTGEQALREARLAGNVLTLSFGGPVEALDDEAGLVAVYSDTPENRAAIEAGAFRILGDKMAGGSA